jgi:ech hydrogenase subunit C
MGFIHSFFQKSRIKSPWLLHYDCGSCNGCDIEILACLTTVYDLERFGIINVGNPKHADIFLVTGTVNPRNRKVLINLYRQIPAPRIVVALGSCALSGGIFREAYNVIGGVDRVIPVDIYVPGCPPRPESIIDGVLLAFKQWTPQNKPLPGQDDPDKVGASCLMK